MGSCSSEQHNTKGLDGTFGRLVWVRRGNGSWWPGQIVDADEMSNGCLDAQKSSGVPIKLLGRDDVNVEWYNLEKTTKVKAFRCGDYDSCIEKAKAWAADPSKRRGKKAQREKAIILALELESALTGKDCTNNCSGAENSSGVVDLTSRNTSSSKENSDSALELSHSGISFEEANAAAALPNNHPTTTAKRLRTPNDSEDDGNEGLKKRMKGLDDLGVGSNVKELNGLVTESAPQCLNSPLDLCGSDHPPTKLVLSGSKGGSMPSFKKKRSKMVFQDIIKRKNRRRMLTKVFQNNALVTVPITSDESNVSVSAGSIFDKALKNASEDPFGAARTSSEPKDDDPSSKSELLGYDSLENLFDVPLINEVEFSDVHQGAPGISYSSLNPPVIPSDALLRENSPAEASAPKNEEQESPDSASSPTVQLSCPALKIAKGPSEWQAKGKRKSRHHYRNLGPEADPWRRPRYFISSRGMFPEPVLYDVHVEVKAAHRPQHVPYISLMSKLNGKPITGHPVAVEVLGDGDCNIIADLPGFYGTSGSSELDDDARRDTPRRPPKKLTRTKKKPGSSMKKTRTLSSLTGSRKKERKERRLVVERVKTPALACIPLKVVFSRINEALNGTTRMTMR